MIDTYSDDVAEFLFFGPDGGSVREVANSAREICDKKGAEIDGPIPPPKVTMEEDDPAFRDDCDAELFGQPPTEKECQVLPGESVSRRILRIYNNSTLINKVASMELPPDVFIRVVVDTRTHGKGNKDAPFSYDPNLDYKTEP